MGLTAKITRFVYGTVIVLIFVLIAAAVSFPKTAFGEEKIELTPALASEVALDFRASLNGSQEVLTAEPIKFFNDSGQAIGYIVEYQLADGSPEGYVVLDNSDASLFSEWSFEDGARSPISSSLGEISVYATNGSSPFVIKSAPFSYAVSIPDRGIILSEEGEDISSDFSIPAEYSSTPNSPDWYAVFIDGFSSDYTMSTFKNAVDEFICFSESEAKSRTGKYGCAVTAMLNCAPHYLNSFNWNNWGADYNSLWSLSNTTVDHTSGGITYGSTPNNKIGPAFASYCEGNGTTVRYSNSMNPFWDFFKSTVDRGDLSIFCAGINIDGARDGHAMAVEGYSILRPSSGAGENIYTLFVADGWDQGRFVNFYYTRYTDTYGVAFSR